jgi:queuine tRNA-ribosyltransferase
LFKLEITYTDGAARTGRLKTARGEIATPAFMTVSTLGATKGLTLEQVEAAGAEVILMNAFHLAWRPGESLIKELGGLHRFTGWKKPILTDSGGYQIFSLPGLRKITEEGAHFSSPVNGELRLFSPETVVELESALGADMVMPLDHCPSHTNTPAEIEAAVERSIRWAERSRKRWRELAPPDVNLFGIIQGACDENLRTRSIEATCALDLPGYALGGFCVGEANPDTRRGIAFSAPRLPADRPRYLMGMGSPADILHSVASGVDLFDCTLPTRNGRNASVFTSSGRLNLRNARFAKDESPLDAACKCYTCRTHSRAYLRHLFLAREMNAAILTSLHNVAFYLNLMRELRAAIAAGRFATFKRECEEKLAREDAPPDADADRAE